MITFHITGHLTDFSDGLHEIKSDAVAGTTREALDLLWQAHPGLRDRVLNEQGEMRPHVNIFVNSENVRRQQKLETPLHDGDEVTILPSVSGG
jgi:molybdopterin synthase sulfur carrier subunit